MNEVDAGFALSQPMYLHLDLATSIHGVASVEVDGPTTGLAAYTATIGAFGSHTERHTRLLLQPGSYRVFLIGAVGSSTRGSESATGTAQLHAGFAVPGSLTTAAAGKALRYVALPPVAGCAAHTLSAAVTPKGKRADDVAQVKVLLGGQVVKKLKHPKKGTSVTLPVPAGQEADLEALVTLRPRRPGHPGKTLTATASYEACP